MKTDHIPQTVAEENHEHGLLWRWADIRIILVLQLTCAIFLSVLDGESAVGFLNNALLFVLSGVVIWLAMILPSFLVRLVYCDKLHWAVSVLLTVAGFVVLSMLLTVIDEKEMLKGSLAMVLCAVSAYKLAHSYFGLRSLGIPFSLGTASRSVTRPTSSEFFSDRNRSFRQRTLVICLLAAPLAAAIFFFSYIENDYYGDGYTTAAIMAALVVFGGYWIAPRLTSAFSGSIRSYRADNPVNSIAYFIIWLTGFCAWVAVALLPLIVICPRYCHERMFDRDELTPLGFSYMFGILLLAQYGLSKLHNRATDTVDKAR